VFNLFKKKSPVFFTATLNARLQPLDRGELEDAFNQAMENHGHGISIVGGGTLMADNGEVSECDLEIEVDKLTANTATLIAGTLEAMFAPKGSRLIQHPDGQQIAFGAQEGLALYLNGSDLADAVYESCSAGHVLSECDALLDGIGMVHSSWNGPTETALYMYGTSFAVMREKVTPFLNAYPLCEKCRVVQIA
jgi:hypothetical protein